MTNSNFSKYKDYAILLQDDQFSNHDSYIEMMKKGTPNAMKSRHSRHLSERLNHEVEPEKDV